MSFIVMRVAFVNFSIVPFGSNDLLYSQAAFALAQEGHQILISTPDWKNQHAKEYQELASYGVRFHLRSGHIRNNNLLLRTAEKAWNKFSSPTLMWRPIAAFKPDLLVICDPGVYSFSSSSGFLDFLESSGIPYITLSQYNDENSAINHLSYSRTRSCFLKAQRCIFVSQRNLDIARRQLCLDLLHGQAICNPPKLERWDICPYPKSNCYTFASVARLDIAVKGQALVLQVLAGESWRNRDWEFNLYGEGPDEWYLKDLISYLGLNKRVHLHGQVNGIRKVWEQNQLHILASSGEGKPLALTEAMLCGRASVVTDVGGNAELIETGLTGFVAESATINSIGRALELAWQSRNQWMEMGHRAREKMKSLLAIPPGRQLADIILSSVNHADHSPSKGFATDN